MTDTRIDEVDDGIFRVSTPAAAIPGAAMVGNADVGREPRALADGETLVTGRRTLRWLDALHVPHGSAPRLLACMHGSAWRGDGAALLRALASAVER